MNGRQEVTSQAGLELVLIGSLVLRPGTGKLLIEESDWSEDKNMNPYAVFE